MSKVKNNRQLALQIPQNKEASAIESRFLALHDSAEVKQVLLREFVYVSTILREFSGVTQQIMDLERSGELQAMNTQDQRNAIASIIAGSNTTFAINSNKDDAAKEKPTEQPRVEAKGLDYGS